MVLAEQMDRIKRELAQEMDEDVHNLDRVRASIDQLDGRQGLGPYGALLLALTGLSFDEEDASRHWKGIRRRRVELAEQAGRSVGLRTALVDYFIDRNRGSTTPTLIQVSLQPSATGTADADPLTGLLCGEALGKYLHAEVQRAKRFRTGFSLLLAQLDDFHGLQATIGPANLGFIQQDLGLLIRNTVRDIDPAARLRPGLFGVILPETDRTGAYLVAERLRQRIRQHFQDRSVGGQPVEVTVSCGIASFPEDAGFGAELLERAQQALYQARSRGRGRVCLHYRERREYIRFDVDPDQVRIDVVEKGKPVAGASTAQEPRDISPQGVLVASTRPYPVGQPVSVICNNLRDLDQIVVRGRVVRIEELNGAAGGPSYEIGLAFDMTWEHQIREIRHFLERLRQPLH